MWVTWYAASGADQWASRWPAIQKCLDAGCPSNREKRKLGFKAGLCKQKNSTTLRYEKCSETDLGFWWKMLFGETVSLGGLGAICRDKIWQLLQSETGCWTKPHLPFLVISANAGTPRGEERSDFRFNRRRCLRGQDLVYCLKKLQSWHVTVSEHRLLIQKLFNRSL